MFLLLPQLVQAAVFCCSSPDEDYQNWRLTQFSDEMQRASSMEYFSDLLVPDWMKQLDAIKVPSEMPVLTLNDAKLQESLNFLANPNVEVNEGSGMINDGLREKAKKIAALLMSSSSYESAGLKEYVFRMEENVRNLPHWLKDNNVRADASAPAVLLGLTKTMAHQVQLIDDKVYIHEKGITYAFGKGLSDSAVEVGSRLHVLLQHGGDIKIGASMVQHLHQIAASSLLETDALKSLVTMIPAGQRFAIGTVSKANYAAVVDMIKTEDGLVFGIKYATSDFFHAPTIAFILSQAQLPELIEFLREDYGPFNDIGTVGGLQWRKVRVSWYPLKLVDIPEVIIHCYAMGGHANIQHVSMGSLIEYCKQLKKATTLAKVTSLANIRGEMHSLVTNLYPPNARMVLSSVLPEYCKNEVGISQATAALKEIMSQLQAKSKENAWVEK